MLKRHKNKLKHGLSRLSSKIDANIECVKINGKGNETWQVLINHDVQ